MAGEHLVLGHFDSVETLRCALRTLSNEHIDVQFSSYTPFPDHHLEEELFRSRKPSPVRYFVFLGGLFGCLSAFLFTSWMSIDYPLRVSAKPLISIPAFVVIAFECTILLAAAAGLLGMLWLSGIPSFVFRQEYRPEFSEGTFGLAARGPDAQTQMLVERMETAGAKRVEVVYVR